MQNTYLIFFYLQKSKITYPYSPTLSEAMKLSTPKPDPKSNT